MTALLLCTDLDRTLLPNGPQPESPEARARFAQVVASPEVRLAYVTGRHRALVETAMREYDLPRPDYVIGDVGSSIYRLDDAGWHPLPEWEAAIGADWAGADVTQLHALFADIAGLERQEAEKQGRFKLSYYTPAEVDVEALRAGLRARLSAPGIRASLIWSIDEALGRGLLDVLPEHATKYHGVEFLMRRLGLSPEMTLFAGDSGNDLEVLASPVPSVLVANAMPEVRAEALARAAAHGHADQLYCARGEWGGMNGCYSAGILEGLAHFHPALSARLDSINPEPR